MTTERFSEPVCVVIVDEGVTEAAVHQHLGSVLPLRVVSWQRQVYMSVVTTLRPQVIVVWGEPEELVHERCQLVASLFSAFEPTVVSATIANVPGHAHQLAVQQLGVGASIRITDLSNIQLP